jgi:hypothetical protein
MFPLSPDLQSKGPTLELLNETPFVVGEADISFIPRYQPQRGSVAYFAETSDVVGVKSVAVTSTTRIPLLKPVFTSSFTVRSKSLPAGISVGGLDTRVNVANCVVVVVWITLTWIGPRTFVTIAAYTNNNRAIANNITVTSLRTFHHS